MFLWNLVLGVSSLAQAPINDLIFTVGTTIRDGGNQDWSYVLVGAVDPALLRGKRFAVYGKAGDVGSAATFALRANLFQQTDTTAINTLLNQSVSLGQNLSTLSQALDNTLRKIPGIAGQPLPQKVLILFQVAATDRQTANITRLLALNHPAVEMCLGQAFAEPIAGVTTYEVREVNPANGVAGDVLGRVTITPGAPIVLPAPGRPFQLVTNHPDDHLVIRLRWGTPDALRRLSLLSYGFNVWRMPRANAEAAGFHLTPPTLAQLYGNPNSYHANEAPTTAAKEFSTGSGAGAADDSADRTTYFFADNNHRSRPGAQAFTDGEEFYYFITARDILGRDGLVSPGGLTRACRRIPPIAPSNPSIRDEPKITPLAGGLTTNEQRFRILWKQNTNTADLVTHYWVYRWPNPTMVFTNDSVPLSNRVGVVVHDPGTNQNSFLDDFAGSPKTPGLSNYWYTIRAVSVAACASLLSPHSPPVSGVLRRRDGPEAATGTLLGSCGKPVVTFTSFLSEADPAAEADRLHYRFVCERRDSGIAWVQFYVTNEVVSTQAFGPIYFSADDHQAEIEFAIRDYLPEPVDVTCVVGTPYGEVSRPVTYRIANPPPPGQRYGAQFLAGQVLLTAAVSGDPLLIALGGGQTFCVPAINPTPDVNGMVEMQFDLPSRPAVLVQALTNTQGQWSDVGTATPDSNGVYEISYPACLIGPLPPFRGCVINLPAEEDCSQHIARAADDGAVAPIQVRFTLTPRTREYRLYRQVNDGPLTLMSQGAAIYSFLRPARRLVRSDDIMPVTAARICYYVQLLDEHGNPSPMSLMGCKEVTPPLPVPVLGEPSPAGNVSDPQVALNWFCPTSGVHRFKVFIERVDKPEAPSGITGSKLLASVKVPHGSLFTTLWKAKRVAIKFGESLFTSPIGPGFGPGPRFSLNASVLPRVPYRISVAAVNVLGGNGPVSQAWDFTWQPPVPPTIVAWPFRPMPPVTTFDDAPGATVDPRVCAVVFTNDAGAFADTQYPVGIRIGELAQRFDAAENIGTTNPVKYYQAGASSGFDPNQNTFRRKSRDPAINGQALLPIVVYRQQVTNAAFPKVSGDIAQVTPLIERIPWTPPEPASSAIYIPDRLIAARWEYVGNDNGAVFLYVRDLQPVILGATYRYFVVRFNAQHEIAQIIPAGEVTLPGSQ
jgi:hypothetical protein